MGSWRMDEYTIDSLSKDLEENAITVPKYQRGAVWNKDQKRKLIDSMNQGFPFGSILLYDKGSTRQIIDGLQRSTTIIEYVKNPASFFEEVSIFDKFSLLEEASLFPELMFSFSLTVKI